MKEGGCTNACIYMETHSQLLLQNRVMDVYETWLGWSSHCPHMCLGFFFYQIRPGLDPRQGKKKSKRASKTKGFTWNAAILVAVLARYSKGWIQDGAKKVEVGPSFDEIFLQTKCSQ